MCGADEISRGKVVWEAEKKRTASRVEWSGSSRGLAMAMAMASGWRVSTFRKWNGKERDRESELGFGEAHGFTPRRDWRYSNVLNVLEGSFVENLGNAAAPGTNITWTSRITVGWENVHPPLGGGVIWLTTLRCNLHCELTIEGALLRKTIIIYLLVCYATCHFCIGWVSWIPKWKPYYGTTLDIVLSVIR